MIINPRTFLLTSHHVFLIVLAFLLMSSTTAIAQAPTPSPAEPPAQKTCHWGQHGMLVFGGQEGLYASHLPMFHAPHDRQVIFRFHLSDAKNDAALRAALANLPEVWSIEPEEFDLDRLQTKAVQALREFSGNVVQGHFERGGTPRFLNQKLIVDEIIVFNALSPSLRQRSEGKYYVIGQGREKFLMKKIDRRPDFDVLIALKPASEKVKISSPSDLQIPANSLKPPTTPAIKQAVTKQRREKFEGAKILYFETGDLR